MQKDNLFMRNIFCSYPFFPLFSVLCISILLSVFFPRISDDIFFFFSLFSFVLLIAFLYFMGQVLYDRILYPVILLLLFFLLLFYVKLRTQDGRFIIGNISSISSFSYVISVDYVKDEFDGKWRRTGGYVRVRADEFRSDERIDVFSRFLIVCKRVFSVKPGWRYCVSPLYISRLERKSIFQDIFSSFRERARSVIDFIPFRKEAGILDAMIFGAREDMDRQLFFDFARFGIAHMIAISGFHFTAVAVLGYFLGGLVAYLIYSTGKSISITPARFQVLVQPFVIKIFFSLIFQLLFLVMCGFVKPAVRAFVMNMVFTLSILSGRNFSPMNTLFASGFIILLLEPADMYNISFILSFSAVLFIVAFSSFSKNSIFWISVYASMGVIPVCIYVGIPISLISPISNIFFSPLFSAAISLGVIGIFLSFLFQPLGILSTVLASLIIKFIIFATELYSPLADIFALPMKVGIPYEVGIPTLFLITLFIRWISRKISRDNIFPYISLATYIIFPLVVYLWGKEKVFVHGNFLVREVRGVGGAEIYVYPIRTRFDLSELIRLGRGAKCLSICFSKVQADIPTCEDEAKMCDFGNIR